jgi:pimeloyl-[acyl-carrier protein] methyl ester esterase
MSPNRTLILLPGLDGTGRLFTPLQKALDPNFQTLVFSYPPDDQLGYDGLCSKVERELPETPYVIVAESISGPIALEIASRKPPGLQALVLSASFAENPRPWLSFLLGGLLGAWCFRLQIPTWTIRALLAGPDAPAELCRAIQDAVKLVNPAVMAFRLREVIKSDAAEALRNCPVPIFYLNGTKDRLLGKGALNRLSTSRQDMTVIDVPGPHMLLQAAPDICAHHIKIMVDGLNWPAT